FPMPEVPPVIKATLFVRRMAMSAIHPDKTGGISTSCRSCKASTVDNQRAPGYEGRGLAGKIQRRPRDFVRTTHTMERPLSGLGEKTIARLAELPRFTAQHGRIGISRAEAVDADVLRAMVDRHGLGKQHHRSLRRAINGGFCASGQTPSGSHI